MRKNLCKLVQHINMLNLHCTDKSPEYIFYDKLLSDEMIELALKLKLRKPTYIADIAKKINKPVSETAKLVDEMAHIGIVEYDCDEKGVDRVKLPIFAPGNMELTAMEVWRMDEHPEIAKAFPEYILGLQQKFAQFFPMGSALMRVIPVEKAIEAESRKVKFEEVSYWVEKCAPSLCVATCECRRIRRMNGEGTNDLEGEWCIGIGSFAENCIRVGKARRITKKEAYEIIERAEEKGYVHQLSNVDGPDESVFICNCNWDTCMGLRTSWYTGTPNMSRSNYVATVNQTNCVACGQCVEICPQNAVKLGQKICQREPVEIKDSITPSDHHWSKKHWRSDLLVNRINVIPETGTSPCKTNCPAHIAVQGYLKLAGQGRYKEALELIKKENPLPAVCGSICPRKCEDVCTRGDIDDPVAIDEVKNFIARKDINEVYRFVPKKIYSHGKKIAVVGSGPAGLSCAYYLAIYGHEVTVFEKEERLGGMLSVGIPSFRLEKDVVDAEIDVLKNLGVTFKTNIEVGKDISISQLREDGYLGFYLAIGAQGKRSLHIPGENHSSVMAGIDFLKSVALKKSEKLKGDVVVIGGGNVAIDVARTAIRNGAESVTLFCVESEKEMPALEEEIREAKEENIVFNPGWGAKEIQIENGNLNSVIFKKCLSVNDKNGRFDPQYDENVMMTAPANYLLTSIGQYIKWNALINDENILLDHNNKPVIDEFTYQTTGPDIFVGGDACTGPKFAIDAIASGKQGAESLHRYVWEGHDLVLGRDRRTYHYIDKENLDISNYDQTPRQRPLHKNAQQLRLEDDRITFTEAQVQDEVKRCLECGAAHVDQNICIGCGVCTTRCKFDAISISKEYDAWGVPYEKLPFAIAKEVVAREVRIIKRKLKGKK
ncbi:FAD-dependent oxidoreductase [Acetobacterium wieringae]|uniref:FAD-dependent oxidoreductase n=1 Tax=Acetobacterium wieringae TaxID=52694 RepID=A0ABY6HHE9_9FIRM|nr:FAD-dependent oxidoreductase [Acetobacterium wieringae]UYO63966.1 FAD-dependent oxidoreductase [Acetobacterium wieringae]